MQRLERVLLELSFEGKERIFAHGFGKRCCISHGQRERRGEEEKRRGMKRERTVQHWGNAMKP